MRRVVADIFFEWNEPLEGFTTWPYLDTHRKADGTLDPIVTTGVGNALFTVQEFVSLPWKRTDGSLASFAEAVAAWDTVRARVDLALKGGGAFAPLTKIRLDRADVEILVRRRLFEMAADLRRRFTRFDEWPASAQLATLSMSWAMGAARFDEFPRFSAFAATSDFLGMAAECEMEHGRARGTLIKRNEKNKALFEFAGIGGDPDAFPWTPLPAPPPVPVGLDPIGTANHHAVADLVARYEPEGDE